MAEQRPTFVVDGKELRFRKLTLGQLGHLGRLANRMMEGDDVIDKVNAIGEAVALLSGEPVAWCSEHFDMAAAQEFVKAGVAVQFNRAGMLTMHLPGRVN